MTLFTKLYLSFIQSLIIFLLSLIFISCSTSSHIPEDPTSSSANMPEPMPVVMPTLQPEDAVAVKASTDMHEPVPEFEKKHLITDISSPHAKTDKRSILTVDKTPSSLTHASLKHTKQLLDVSDKKISVNKSISAKNSVNIDNYLVRLTADKKIKTTGSPGKAVIWIGDPSFRQDVPSSDDVYAEKNISGIGQWVKLGLNAPDFQDVHESECMWIPPTGTEEVFWLYPKQTKNGNYKISAYVKLFTSKECSDSFNQKFSDVVEVEVKIDYDTIFMEMLKDLWNIFWEKALWFWGALLALIFTLILRKLKQRFEDQ